MPALVQTLCRGTVHARVFPHSCVNNSSVYGTVVTEGGGGGALQMCVYSTCESQ